MTDLRTAAQQALEALKGVVVAHSYQSGTPVEAITALDAALAQEQAEPAQEPEPVDVGLLEYRGNSVAFIHQKMTAYRTGIDAAWDAFRAKGLHPDGKTSLADMIAKHAAPPQREPLTEGVLMGVYIDFDRAADPAWSKVEYLLQFARAVERAIERAHGIGDNT